MEEPPEEDLSVSVIVPVKNSARTIRDLMESLMSLSYDRDLLEVVVVDGNSTDGTRKIVEEYPVTLVNEDGRGLNAARNTGIKWSSGQIVAFTDGDCIVPPGWANAIAKNFQDPDVGFVGGSVEGYEKEGFVSTYMDETFFRVKPEFKWRMEGTSLSLLHFPAGCNMAFRRHALSKIHFFDERIEHGFDELYTVEKLGERGLRIVLDPEVYVYHHHRTNLREVLKQHFNYGRGGALLILAKRASTLARWFRTYLFSSAFGILLMLFLLASGLLLKSMLPILLGAGLFSLSFAVLTSFYTKTAKRTRSLGKLFLYPILDMARGVSFTLGGLTQLLKSIFGRRA
ncbi:MAG: glycosyltransferase [Candidatus Bathyarchaeota archaeon]|nr:MAG: glycosyltransferase [Candidatus Bathyarchaeota archaeon]